MANLSKNEILRQTTIDYLSTADPDISLETIEMELIEIVNTKLRLENAVKDKNEKFSYIHELTFGQIALIVANRFDVCRVSCAGDNADEDYDFLAIYQDEDSPDYGTYSISDATFRKIFRRLNFNLTNRMFEETMSALKDIVPRKHRCIDKDLIAVNNGIFNYETKELMPFDSDYVFLAKSHVNYNPNAKNVVITNPIDQSQWDIESWMAGLSDDPEIVQVLWEILGAIIRPNVRWNKSAWLYSETGNNGKGTLCELMRSLCGAGSYASIPISDFAKDFLLEPLTRATAVIVDENDVGTFIDKAANLKACITNDVIQINRKFKTPIAYQFYGFMVQCLNEFPRIRDKSDSFYRRQLFIPFDKCFTGKERKYIKNDYLHRDEVLEYVLFKVLNMNYYTLSEPLRCKMVLEEYKEFNDPVRQFFDEFEDQFVWDLLPFGFLYELYKAWFAKNSPSGSPQGKKTFINDLLNVINGSTMWYCTDKTQNIKPSNRMNKPELLIVQYGLNDWKNQNYKGNDVNKMCQPLLASTYRGLQRYPTPQNITSTDEEDDDE